jgi:hypothetical protein
MVIGTQSEIVTTKDYFKICQENEYFFWHFISNNNSHRSTVIKPVTNITGEYFHSPLNEIQNQLGIKIYESFTEDSVDFLINLGYKSNNIFLPKCGCFGSLFIGFKHGVKVAGTAAEVKCYCTEGVTEVIYLTNSLLFE